MEDYIIDSMEWYKGMELHHDVRLTFLTLAGFLQENGLTRRTLAGSIAEVDERFCIRASDLTEEGLALMKACYAKWIRGIDKGKPPGDIRILERGLKTLRG